MNAVWLDFLRTPMAAPETKELRQLRMIVLSLAIALAVSVVMLGPLRWALGLGAGGAIAGLLLALAVLVPVYVVRKNRADGAYLDELCQGHEDRGDVGASEEAA
jgi:membrane associated rhomboid family serine protease